jgi:hypothetical protein
MNASPVARQSTNKPPRSALLPNVLGLNGAIAGLGGGVAMAVVAALLTRAIDQDIWLQPKVIASLVLGASVAEPGFDAAAVAVGTLIHLIVAAALGVIFEVAMRRMLRLPSDLGVPMLTGLVYGLMTWMVAYFVAIPALSPRLLTVYAPAFIIQHIVYGVVLSLIYAWLRPQPYTSTV